MAATRGKPLSNEAKVIALATERGVAAGKAFIEEWGLGRNRKLDDLFYEGIETYASIIVSRLPWADLSGEWADEPTPKLVLRSLGIEADMEVADGLIDLYQHQYDMSSRNVILETVKGNR